ncbi:MAG: AMP-binding protein [Bacillota bacterium]
MTDRIKNCIEQLNTMDFHTLIEMTFGDLLDAQAERFGDNECVVDTYGGRRMTYKQFRDECNTIARGLMAIGVKRNSHVAIWATNRLEWLTLMFATAKIGAVLVTVNTNYKRFELEYLMRQSDSMTLVLIDGFKDSDYMQHLSDICPELAASEPGRLESPALPFLKNVIRIDGERRPGTLLWKDLYELAEQVPAEEQQKLQASLDFHDVINMQYTSGTTGFPKGVMLTHHSVVNNGKSIGDRKALTERDRECIPVPLFHCFGCVLGVTSCVTHASTMVLLDHFNPDMVLKTVQKERCTSLLGVPTMFISALAHPDFAQYDLSSLRTGIMAGSPCPIEVMKRVNNEMHMPEVTIAFGQTESSPVTTMTAVDDPIEKRVNTIGRCQPNVEIKIVDPETGLEVGVGMPGEFLTRGYQVMKGYYKLPEATKQAIDEDGWLHTGDLCSIDADGYYKVTGRLKDMIIRGGENIYPREIEEYLYTHPKVQDVQVVGVPDLKYGEEVLAFVIKKDPSDALSGADLIEYVKTGLSRYKAPRYVEFIDSFPMTASGKIQKYKLREMGIELLGLQAAAAVETA